MRDRGRTISFPPNDNSLRYVAFLHRSPSISSKKRGWTKKTTDATTVTEDHLEERNANVLRNLKEGKDRDRFDVVIPERILPAFLSTQPKEMLRDIRRLRKELETALGNADIAFAAIGQQTLTDLQK